MEGEQAESAILALLTCHLRRNPNPNKTKFLAVVTGGGKLDALLLLHFIVNRKIALKQR